MVPQGMLGGNLVVLSSADIHMHRTKKGEPPNRDNRKRILGTIQIFSSFMVMIMGFLLACTHFPHHFLSLSVALVTSGYPFFFVSGLLSVIMEKRSNKHLVWANLAANFLSLVMASVGFILIPVLMATVLAARRQCELDIVPRQPSQNSYFNSENMALKCVLASSILLGLLSGMFLFTLVEFCVAIPTSILWWRQAHSGISGGVRFLAQGDMAATGTSPKASVNPGPGTDEPVTSEERENEGDRKRERDGVRGGRE